MLTLTFLWTWTKMTVATVLVVVVERAVLTEFWVVTPVVAVTVLVWAALCVGLFREWRTHATGHRHQVTEFRREHL
ncbi:hypothetical protein BAY61_26465 [Prauserella marina]|uniref:Uncharacterized protein n=1 Tax=Prauserella marina TaxID=530584 RepID=A0A222VVI9_9PSEU|nr:hypothetical protein [Prauserella marina]ASR37966.1 hypothetical protein BAY61_26465 [Prauserella marina]PWV73191.1 hypothetical protein DES30_109141 [Prauserella marina]SDD69737.1 hypothetical protein SAMN05421630_111132 [Prauserella marina]